LHEIRVLVFYEPHNEPVLDKVRQRMRIDAALPMPATEEAIKAVLKEWL
jgi:lauroyl/myristoyl acyltransferase